MYQLRRTGVTEPLAMKWALRRIVGYLSGSKADRSIFEPARFSKLVIALLLVAFRIEMLIQVLGGSVLLINKESQP